MQLKNLVTPDLQNVVKNVQCVIIHSMKFYGFSCNEWPINK